MKMRQAEYLARLFAYASLCDLEITGEAGQTEEEIEEIEGAYAAFLYELRRDLEDRSDDLAARTPDRRRDNRQKPDML